MRVRALLLVLGVGAGATSTAEADPTPRHRLIGVDVVRRATRHPDDDPLDWPNGFFGLEVQLHDGPAGEPAVDGVRAALTRFAVTSDGAALASALADLDAGERLLGFAALGAALAVGYTADPDAPAAGHAASLAAVADWLATGRVGDTGRCGAIHDSLRRIAVSAGCRDAVTLTVGDRHTASHIVLAVPGDAGWAVVDYGALLLTDAPTLTDLIDLASTRRGRVLGEAVIWRDGFWARRATRAGTATRALLDHDVAWQPSCWDDVGAPAHALEGQVGEDGAWTTLRSASPASPWTLRAMAGALRAPATLGGRLSPATGGAVGWHAGENGWFASVRCSAGLVGWRTPEGVQPTWLVGLRALTGGRWRLGAHGLAAALVFDGLGDGAGILRGLAGRRTDAFVEALHPGVTAGWRWGAGATAWTFAAWGFATVAPAKARSDTRRLYADRAGARAAWAVGAFTTSAEMGVDRTGWSGRVGAGWSGGVLRAEGWAEHRQSARPALEPTIDRVGLELRAGPDRCWASMEWVASVAGGPGARALTAGVSVQAGFAW